MPTTRATSTTRRRLALIGVLAALAVIALACGSSKKSTDTAAGDTSSTTAASSSTTSGDGYGDTSKSTSTTAGGAASGFSVAVATTSLGPVVVDAKGLTLYLFEKDTGPTSTCVDACAKAWPPATVSGTPTAGTGVTGALTTTTRTDGTTQIVLNGHPLYRFASDAAPGDVNGQDVGGTWYAVSASGEAVE